MGTIVVAQIGKTKYTETTYKRHKDEVGVKSKYAFEAVLHEALAKNPDKVNLILLVTKDSCFGTVYEDFASEIRDLKLDPALITKVYNKWETEVGKTVSDIDNREIRSKYETDLSRKLTEHFSAYSQIEVTVAIIDQGQSGEELPANFEVILAAVEGVIPVTDSNNQEEESTNQQEKPDLHWDIYFDITNGFRSFPIYIYTLTNYLSRIRSNHAICHIYYGMFDVSEELGYTPLVNLRVVDDLLQLINAVSEFQNCGSVKQILEILKIRTDLDIEIEKEDMNGEKVTHRLSDAFKLFDYGTNANNLKDIEDGIILLKDLGLHVDEKIGHDKAESLLLNNISSDFSLRFSNIDVEGNLKKYPYSNLMIQLADWYHETGREGNAAIAVQEALITYIIERYSDRTYWYLQEIYPSNVEEIESAELLRQGDEDHLFKHIIRESVKQKLDDAVNRLLQESKEILSEAEEILPEKDINGVFGAYDKNRKLFRNTMAHFSYESSASTEYETGLLEKLKEEIKKAEEASDKIDESFGNKLVSTLFRSTEDNLKKKKLEEVIEKISHDQLFTVVDYYKFNQNLRAFGDQLRSLKAAVEMKKEFDDFWLEFQSEVEKSATPNILVKVFDAWILLTGNGQELSEQTYRNYYNKGRWTLNNNVFIRLKNFIKSGGMGIVISILESDQA